MKKIIIKFYGLGYNNVNQANVSIYNSNRNLIFEGNTFNNEIELCLKENEIYILNATSSIGSITRVFYVKNDLYLYYSFVELLPIINPPITFLLTDYYYDNLPIERGELLLWQK